MAEFWSPLARFAMFVLVASSLTVARAWLSRGRFFGTFAAVILGIQGAIAIGQWDNMALAWPLYVALQATLYVHIASLTQPKMRSLAWRLLVSGPALCFLGATLLGLPWAVMAIFGVYLPLPWLPFLLAAIGATQSWRTRQRDVDLVLPASDKIPPVGEPHLARARSEKVPDDAARPLRLVQITDPHLGPFMTVERLRQICQRAVERAPDLVLLTGDYLTMDSQANAEDLMEALSPLAQMPGQVFACFGNHDLEAPELVIAAMAANGIELLIDAEACVQTPAGPVQIIGADFAFRDSGPRLRALSARLPRRPDHLRLWLLHDPGAFKHLTDGAADLVLAGHTHGGQLGLVSLGLAPTVVSLLTSIPDHGLWAKGRNLLYVHRGTGHYGFPIRLGVPAEEGTLRVHRPLLIAITEKTLINN